MNWLIWPDGRKERVPEGGGWYLMARDERGVEHKFVCSGWAEEGNVLSITYRVGESQDCSCTRSRDAAE